MTYEQPLGGLFFLGALGDLYFSLPRWFNSDFAPISAAAMHKLHAVALAEPAAAKVLFQRFQGNTPPHKNINSAGAGELAAMAFSGKRAKYAIFAAYFA